LEAHNGLTDWVQRLMWSLGTGGSRNKVYGQNQRCYMTGEKETNIGIESGSWL